MNVGCCACGRPGCEFCDPTIWQRGYLTLPVEFQPYIVTSIGALPETGTAGTWDNAFTSEN